jgi:hypothetical protein
MQNESEGAETMNPTISDIALVVIAVVGVVALFHGFG